VFVDFFQLLPPPSPLLDVLALIAGRADGLEIRGF